MRKGNQSRLPLFINGRYKLGNANILVKTFQAGATKSWFIISDFMKLIHDKRKWKTAIDIKRILFFFNTVNIIFPDSHILSSNIMALLANSDLYLHI